MVGGDIPPKTCFLGESEVFVNRFFGIT